MLKKFLFSPSIRGSPLSPFLHKSSPLSLSSYYYSCFATSNSNFSSQQYSNLPIASQLKQALLKQNFEYLTNIQNLSMSTLLEGKNTLLQAETGSGKTLCYIVPILHDLLSKSTKKDAIHDNREPRGALILAPNKELVAQIYSFIKQVDPQDKIRITRLGAMNNSTPASTFLDSKVPGQATTTTTNDQVSNMVSWSTLDILISTPVQLSNMINIKDKSDPYDINPKIIVIDEYDLLFGDITLARATKNIIKKFTKTQKSIFGEINDRRQFILCGATGPKKIGSVSLQEEVENWIGDLEVLKTEGFHKISENIEFEYFDVPKGTKEETELLMLRKFLKMCDEKKIIIFCNSTERSRKVFELVSEMGENCGAFFAGMEAEDRIDILSRFNNGELRILIATDLASRGLDFKNVEHVIQFDFGLNATTVLHRAGRTGRCGEKGKCTSFIREKDELLMTKITEIVENDEEFDAAFSHKRSLRKVYKRNKKAEEEEENSKQQAQ